MVGLEKATVLIIEDELPLMESLTYTLRKEGYRVLSARDGKTGLSLARQHEPDLILLDILLPGMDGLEVCRILRRESKVPVIMLTAKAEEADKVVGLELGADDYVTKPFGMRELLARIKAVLRRTHEPSTINHEILESENLLMNLAEHTVTLNGQPLSLSPREFDLLRVLMQNRGRVMSRERLLDSVWGVTEFIDPHTVDVHIHWLREKIEENPSQPRRIVTVRGAGYKFVG